MSAFKRGLLAVFVGALLLMGSTPSAWADKSDHDIAEMDILVGSHLSSEPLEVEYDGKPVTPPVLLAPMLSRAQLEMVEIPSDAQSIALYEYRSVVIDGDQADSVEVVSYDADRRCLTVNMFAKFEADTSAEQYLERIENEYGKHFIKGSATDGITFAQVDMRPSFLDKDEYEQAFRDILIDFEKAPLNGRDYLVTYDNNDKPGAATVTVTGMGAYRGSQAVPFVIVDKISDSPDSHADSENASESFGAHVGLILGMGIVGAVAIVLLVLRREKKSLDS